MGKRTLFHLLLERPWHFSLLVAAGVFLVFGMFSAVIGAAAATPFIGIAGYIGWRRLKTGPAADPAELLRAMRDASAEEIRMVLAEAYAREGYQIGDTPEGDLLLDRQGYKTLVRYRRWRAQSTAAQALEELAKVMKKHDADRGTHIAIGTFTEAAKSIAEPASITPIDGAGLALFLKYVPAAHRLIKKQAQTKQTS